MFHYSINWPHLAQTVLSYLLFFWIMCMYHVMFVVLKREQCEENGEWDGISSGKINGYVCP